MEPGTSWPLLQTLSAYKYPTQGEDVTKKATVSRLSFQQSRQQRLPSEVLLQLMPQASWDKRPGPCSLPRQVSELLTPSPQTSSLSILVSAFLLAAFWILYVPPYLLSFFSLLLIISLPVFLSHCLFLSFSVNYETDPQSTFFTQKTKRSSCFECSPPKMKQKCGCPDALPTTSEGSWEDLLRSSGCLE